jgi:hypothetical protein
VVVGTVADLEAFWSTNGGIERRAMLDVSHTVRGAAMTSAELVLPGGQIGENWQHVEDVPDLKQGERYLLFLHRLDRGYEVIGGFQGAVSIGSKVQKGENLQRVLADLEGCHAK